ncbi:hypothetical protein DL762_004148 [Monosporascus cannonballus]|uniref:Glycosyl hydrolase n=1 Tax=Monosporascus cannonballus TaxID=155416 RepID=A0ABY0HCZ3_9PEZI|nr:hypothetical protein DL762_004148 [Monosporascus cannonballus]
MARHQLTLSSFVSILLQFFLFASRIWAFQKPTSHDPISAQPQECPVFFTGSEPCDPVAPKSFLPPNVAAVLNSNRHHERGFDVLGEMLGAMNILQDEFYELWLGTWPSGIDWTRAVLGTHVSGGIRTLSESLASMKLDKDGALDWKLKSSMIDSFFTQITAYYFGEDAFAIRNEAYDDILWVVLGWLEAVRFLSTHTDLHYNFKPQGMALQSEIERTSHGFDTILSNLTYHGNLWIPAFSHRARVFWDLSLKGWDTELCDGGMIWNPRLLPYKNAITNELFIAASISMYLYFPGDDNGSPFSDKQHPAEADPHGSASGTYSGPRDPKYLKAAIDGYRWLAGSNMTDTQGLYTDGFHISGYRDSDSNNTKCDEREDTVLTYNQGVLLTGLRGLWDATGAPSYLSDGHALVQNVIRATGYDLGEDAPVEDASALRPGRLPRWHGLGRAGVLEDPCDAAGVCNQDAPTFKGIYFHHLTAFCAPLAAPEDVRAGEVFDAARRSHADACASYRGWLAHNARAALATRDGRGRFGQWWTAGLLAGSWSGPWPTVADDGVPRDFAGHTDHALWRGPYDPALIHPDPGAGEEDDDAPLPAPGGPQDQQPLLLRRSTERQPAPAGGLGKKRRGRGSTAAWPVGDPNLRGRGRTVETHSGGLALLRAYWKIGQRAP